MSTRATSAQRRPARAPATLQTLPDLLKSGLDLVFVGINPSVYSVEQGHYFARRSNRFWPCLSASVLSERARIGLATGQLTSRHDRALLQYGIGFTDVVKRATAKASELSAAELEAGARQLLIRLRRQTPRVACFHGVTGYRAVQRALTGGDDPIVLGAQPVRLGASCVFVVPNPSGANAHFTRDEQTGWYDRLAAHLRDGA